MTFLATLTTIVGTVGLFAYIPQLIKIFKRKSAKDISLITYFLFVFVNFTWFLYGLEIMSFPLGFTSIIAIMFQLLIIIGCFLYGREKPKNKKKRK